MPNSPKDLIQRETLRRLKDSTKRLSTLETMEPGSGYASLTDDQTFAGLNTFSQDVEIAATKAGVLRARVNNGSNSASAFASYQMLNDAAVAAGFLLNSSGNSAYGGANSLNLIQSGNHHLALGTNNLVRMFIENTGRLGVGTLTPGAHVHLRQPSTTAAIAVLALQQLDVSEPMIELETTVGTGNTIEAVGAKTLTVTHFLKVRLPDDSIAYIPMGTIAAIALLYTWAQVFLSTTQLIVA